MTQLKSLVCLILCFVFSFSFAQDYSNLTDNKGRQGQWKIYFDSGMDVVSSPDSATFYRLINYKDDKPIGIVYDYYLDGKLAKEATLISDRPIDLPHGRVVEHLEEDTIRVIKYYNNGNVDIKETIYQLEKESFKDFSTLFSLGQAYLAYRNKEKANYYLKTLANKSKSIGGDNSLQYGIILNSWAWVFTRHNEYIEAEKLFFQAKRIYDNYKEKYPILYGIILNDIGDFYSLSGRCDEGIKYLTEAEEIFEKHTSKNDYLRFIVLNNLAGCYRFNNDYEKAVESLELVYKNAVQRFGRLNRETANTLANLGTSYTGIGETDKGLKLIKESLDIYEELFGKEHKEYLEKKYFYGRSFYSAGKLEEALVILTEVYDKYIELFGEKSDNAIQFGRSKAFALYRLGRKNEAIEILRTTAQQRQDYLHEYLIT